ncbi:MAG TPA: APC family permease [Caulobacteraceae bacterium]|nr:APC family permease [Caulobacteraceae bacterium]
MAFSSSRTEPNRELLIGAPPPGQTASLQKTIGAAQFAVFGFGSIVGSAWVILLGIWLLHAGPGGAAVGIALGGAGMALIAAMYAELASRFPQTGGEVTYINAVFGKAAGFVVGWLLTLAYLSGLALEGVALTWLLEVLWPPIAGRTLYVIFGQPVGSGGLLVSLGCWATIAWLNYRGARSFVRFQNTLTALFLLVVFVAIGFELYFGSNHNLRPVWRSGDGESWLIGAAWVFGSAPIMFNSFQAVLQAIEERSHTTSKEVVVRLAIVAVGCAALFYLLVVFAAARATPWRALATSDLPAIHALASLPWSGALKTALLLALIASLLKTWSAVFMTAVRLLFAQAREGMIPGFFGSVNPRTGSPDKAVIVVAAINFAGLFLGKGMLMPIINIVSLAIALIFALICAAALVMRKRDPEHVGFRTPGGYPVGTLAVLAALAMAVFALLQPTPKSPAADALKWTLLASWTLLGLALFVSRNRTLLSARRVS